MYGVTLNDFMLERSEQHFNLNPEHRLHARSEIKDPLG